VRHVHVPLMSLLTASSSKSSLFRGCGHFGVRSYSSWDCLSSPSGLATLLRFRCLSFLGVRRDCLSSGALAPARSTFHGLRGGVFLSCCSQLSSECLRLLLLSPLLLLPPPAGGGGPPPGAFGLGGGGPRPDCSRWPPRLAHDQ
jgi:hypothetical protein